MRSRIQKNQLFAKETESKVYKAAIYFFMLHLQWQAAVNPRLISYYAA